MAETPVVKQSALRTALAGLIGNVLEWFDFAVYGYFASNIGHQFFPKSDPAAQQFLAFAVFALGFLARPAGSLILGRVGDRIGRRPLLTLSIGLMGVATLILGLLPTYDQIGVAAPLLLMLMRVAQGFSLGGEFTGSMVYTTEAASPLIRGLVSSSTAAGTTIGFILGSATAWAINENLTPAQVDAWDGAFRSSAVSSFWSSATCCGAGSWKRTKGSRPSPLGLRCGPPSSLTACRSFRPSELSR